jgi:hypothetical protein
MFLCICESIVHSSWIGLPGAGAWGSWTLFILISWVRGSLPLDRMFNLTNILLYWKDGKNCLIFIFFCFSLVHIKNCYVKIHVMFLLPYKRPPPPLPWTDEPKSENYWTLKRTGMIAFSNPALWLAEANLLMLLAGTAQAK